MKKQEIMFFTAIILFFSCFIPSCVYAQAQDEPFPEYYRYITIYSPEELTNYTIRLVFNTDNFDFSHVKNDGSDIFFLDKSGKPLYFWIEYINTTSGVMYLWLKLNLSNGNNTIIMYYGGHNFYPSYNNPDEVFVFFEDFSDGLPSDWSWSSVGWSVVDGVLNYYTGAPPKLGLGNKSYTFKMGYAIGGKMYVPSSTSYSSGFYLFYPSYRIYLKAYSNGTYVVEGEGTSSETITSDKPTSWKRIELAFNSTSDSGGTGYARIIVGNTIYKTDVAWVESTKIGVFSYEEVYMDFIYIRKYSDAEISMKTTIGEEHLSQPKYNDRFEALRPGHALVLLPGYEGPYVVRVFNSSEYVAPLTLVNFKEYRLIVKKEAFILENNTIGSSFEPVYFPLEQVVEVYVFGDRKEIVVILSDIPYPTIPPGTFTPVVIYPYAKPANYSHLSPPSSLISDVNNATVGGIISTGILLGVAVAMIRMREPLPHALAAASAFLLMLGLIFGNYGIISVAATVFVLSLSFILAMRLRI